MKIFKEKNPRILFNQFLFFEHSLRWFLMNSPNHNFTHLFLELLNHPCFMILEHVTIVVANVDQLPKKFPKKVL